MKKLITLMLALAFGFGLKAQCPYTEAMDFTATDCHGTEVHLFDILDGGQAVLIDFFFTTCGPCQQATPKIVESYYAMGCNMHDVFYMEISTSDGDAACQNWAANYGVEYPTISTNGGGNAICNQYGIQQYPTVILIMPNHQIVIQDLWPINNAQTVISALEQHGLQQHDCNASGDVIPDFIGTDVEGNEVHLYDILDVGQAVFINFFLYGDEYSEAPMEDVIEAYRLYGCNAHDVFFMEISPNGTDANCQAWVDRFGVEYPTISRDGGGNDIAQSIPVGFYPTLMLVRPDHTIAMRDIYPPTLEYIVDAMEVEGYEQYECPVVYDETLTFSMDTVMLPWCEVTWITVYNNTVQDVTITSICDDRYELGFYIGEEPVLSCNTIEYTIPQGGSVELGIECCVTGKSIVPDLVTITSNLPDAHFVVMVDDTWSVDENEASTTLFPNPANNFVTLKGEDLGTVRIYNALGQKVDEFEANDNELNINTAGYESGVYVVKAGEKTLRFVVRH